MLWERAREEGDLVLGISARSWRMAWDDFAFVVRPSGRRSSHLEINFIPTELGTGQSVDVEPCHKKRVEKKKRRFSLFCLCKEMQIARVVVRGVSDVSVIMTAFSLAPSWTEWTLCRYVHKRWKIPEKSERRCFLDLAVQLKLL